MAEENTEPGWFYVDQSRDRQGPFTVPEFKALADEGTIQAETLVWSQGYEAWMPARKLAGLIPEGQSNSPPSAPSKVTPPPAEKEKSNHETIPDEELKPRKGSFIFPRLVRGFLLAVFLGAASAAGCFFLQVTPLIGLGVFALILTLAVTGAFIGYHKERYQVSGSTVLCHRGGITSDQTTEVEICNITHVAMKLPWLRHKLFGIGTIEIDSAGTARPVVFRAIEEPRVVYQRLAERMKSNGYQLRKNELLHEESPAILGILSEAGKIVFGVGALFLFSWSTVLGFHEAIVRQGLGWLLYSALGVLGFGGLGYFLIFFLDMRQRRYRVYDDVVTYEEGFLTRRDAFIPCENIADAATTRTFWDQILNLYDVVISCQGSSKEIKFRRLKEGIHLTESIEQLVTAANRKPSPAEVVAGRRTSKSSQQTPARDEPKLVAPGEEWIADLKMSPLRVFVPLLILLPVFPLWILAMLQAAIRVWSTTYEVREATIKHSYRFLTTVEREFAYDKITGLVVKKNLLDRLFGTFTLKLWSIGSGQSLELAHIHRSLVDLDGLLHQIGIPSHSKNVHEIPTRFGIGAWLRAHCYRLGLALLAVHAFVAAAFYFEEPLLHAGAVFPLLLLALGMAYAWIFYSKQTFSLQDHHLEAQQGILAKRFYFARYRNVKKTLVTRYPGGKSGSLQIFVAGEQIITSKSEQGKGGKIPIPCSFTLGFLPEVLSQGNLLDHLLAGKVKNGSEDLEEPPRELVLESRRGIGNSVFGLIAWSLVLVPLVVLLPLTLPLTILAKRRWRYRLEEDRVVSSWGLLFRKQASVLLDRVDSLQQRQGLLNKIFKNGSVSIMTAGSSKPDLVMPAAKDFHKLYQTIRERSQKG